MKDHLATISLVIALSLGWTLSVLASSSVHTLTVSSIPRTHRRRGPQYYSERRFGLHDSASEIDSVKLASSTTRKRRRLRDLIPVDDGTLKDRWTTRVYNLPVSSGPRASAVINGKLQFVNWAVYALQYMFPAITNWGIKLSDKILAGEDLYRIFTPMFLHGNLAHLFTNSQSLGAVGPQLERILGPGRYLSAYLVSGIAGNVASTVMTPFPSLGASGAVFGLMGSFFTVLTMNQQFFGANGMNYMSQVASGMAVNVLFGLMSPQIDNWAHIGGAVGGALFTYYFGPRLQLRQRLNGEVFVVDSPRLRFPRTLESIPEEVYKRVTQMKRRARTKVHLEDLPDLDDYLPNDLDDYEPKDYVPTQ